MRYTLKAAIAFAVFLAATAHAETIKLGVTVGPHAQIAEALKPIAKAKGLDVQIIEFSDGALINSATNEGELDANGFQHTPYLEGQNKDRQLGLVSAGRTVLLPMAAYSKRVKAVADLKQGALISIPSDPSNGGRALKLLEAGGLLKLKPGVTWNATVFDIVENPKKLEIKELETAQLPRSLEDVDFSVITTHFALASGLNPSKDSILREGDLSEYFCLIAVKKENLDKPWLKTLLEAYRSPEVKAFVEKTFQGNVIAGW